MAKPTVPEQQLFESQLDPSKKWKLYAEKEDHLLLMPVISESIRTTASFLVDFGIAPPESMEIVLLCSETFSRSLALEPWIDALHHRGRIFLPLSCQVKPDSGYLKSIIRHEYVHAAIYGAGVEVPDWLDEGLAIVVENNIDAQGRIDLLKQLKTTTPDVTWLKKSSSPHKLNNLAWTVLAQCASGFLIERHPDLITDIIQNKKDGLSPVLFSQMVAWCRDSLQKQY